MLGLVLRDEFRRQHLPATAISLVEPDDSGAPQVSPSRILTITYPTSDIQTALRALSAAPVTRLFLCLFARRPEGTQLELLQVAQSEA